ncbi:putative [NiFe]-hydrogenase-type-3 Eha complex membrane subunit A [Methanobacterium congolense]|uniref:Probable [NiFe]-hydrogenase-type-3 Eha complex membrane subunit A n=2 Tax=Methanobacterium congolense TaxID=118062 RepID=A0A1D3L1W4_9EURY|nr:putative [NiFe]-hydrogenase-type-3 Eha complex membrane subunit A [Methanobacterium congolense]
MIIHVNVVYTMMSYILAIISAIIVGLILRMPLLPERPMRQSWTISVIFPTAVLAVGFTAMVFGLGYEGTNGMIIGVIVGVLTALFSKFFLEKIVPRPKVEESN